jgi:hypothetical protein
MRMVALSLVRVRVLCSGIVGVMSSSLPRFSFVFCKTFRMRRPRLITKTRTAEFLERNHRLVILVVVIDDNFLVAAFADNQTRVTPTEVVHAPERVDREEETVDRITARNEQVRREVKGGNVRKKVDNHPTYKHELALDDKHERLQTVDRRNHDNGNKRESCFAGSNGDNEVSQLNTWSARPRLAKDERT